MNTALFPFEACNAVFSPCRIWRYALRRQWSTGDRVCFILLNPSTADETQDDPTIRRCIRYAKDWGYGGMVLGNIFAFRATNPCDMRAAADPVGKLNDSWLLALAAEAQGNIVCGWGNHGAFMGRGAAVLQMLRENDWKPKALAKTGTGEPGHPLYLRANLLPFEIAPSPYPR
jgi:hypothetical protein